MNHIQPAETTTFSDLAFRQVTWQNGKCFLNAMGHAGVITKTHPEMVKGRELGHGKTTTEDAGANPGALR